MRLFLDPMKSDYTPEVIENNFLEEGFILGVGFNPHDYQIGSPIILKPGTKVKVGMKARANAPQKSKNPIFPRLCAENPELKILKGLGHTEI